MFVLMSSSYFQILPTIVCLVAVHSCLSAGQPRGVLFPQGRDTCSTGEPCAHPQSPNHRAPSLVLLRLAPEPATRSLIDTVANPALHQVAQANVEQVFPASFIGG